MKKIIDLIDNSNLFDIEIEYTKKFSKNDIYFKQFLIKKIIKTNEKIFYLTEKETKKILIFQHGENFDIFLKKFCSKRLESSIKSIIFFKVYPPFPKKYFNINEKFSILQTLISI